MCSSRFDFRQISPAAATSCCSRPFSFTRNHPRGAARALAHARPKPRGRRYLRRIPSQHKGPLLYPVSGLTHRLATGGGDSSSRDFFGCVRTDTFVPPPRASAALPPAWGPARAAVSWNTSMVRQVSYSRLKYMRRTQVSLREHVIRIRTYVQLTLFFTARGRETPANDCDELSEQRPFRGRYSDGDC